MLPVTAYHEVRQKENEVKKDFRDEETPKNGYPSNHFTRNKGITKVLLQDSKPVLNNQNTRGASKLARISSYKKKKQTKYMNRHYRDKSKTGKNLILNTGHLLPFTIHCFFPQRDIIVSSSHSQQVSGQRP